MSTRLSPDVDIARSSQSTRLVRWVIPAYNESASIEDLLDRIAQVSEDSGWQWDVIVVDDGSEDGTGDIVKAMIEQGLPAQVLRNEPNQGLGRTLRRGLRAALDGRSKVERDSDVIITLDADLTQDPLYGPLLVAALDQGADVAIASRYRPGSGVEGLSLTRRLLSYVASALVGLVRPVRNVRDYSCGFRAYRSTAIADGFAAYNDDFVSESGFACMLEIAERLRDRATFVEIPFVLHYQDKRKASAIKIMPTIAAYGRVIAKVARSGRKQVPVMTLVVAFSAIICSSVAQVMLRLGMQGVGDVSIGQTLAAAAVSPVVIAGLVLYAISAALWLGVLSRMELSVAYPLGASGYVLVVVLAAISGEVVPPQRWAGVVTIIAGILLVGWLGVVPVKRVSEQ